MPLDPDLLVPFLTRMGCPALVLDPDRRVVLHNPRLAALWPVAPDVLARRPTLAEWLAELCAAGVLGEGPAGEGFARWEDLFAGDNTAPLTMPSPEGAMSARVEPLPGGGALVTLHPVDLTQGTGYFPPEVESLQDKGLQTELEEAREFSDSLVMNSAVATFVLDADHRVALWNRACEELTGVAAETVVGTRDHWRAFYPERHRCLADYVLDEETPPTEDFYEQWAHSPLAPNALRGERWIRRPDGGERYLAFEAAPIRDRAGAVVAVIETLHDLTDRRQAAEALMDSENRYRALFEGAGDGIVILDTDPADRGRIITANAAAAEMHGWAQPDLPGRNMSEFATPDTVRRVGENLSRVRGGKRLLFQVDHLRRDGTRFPVEVRAVPVAMGEERYTLAVIRDVSDRHRAEEQARLLTSAVAQVDDGIAVCDVEGRIIYANPAFAAAAGMDPASAVGSPVPLPGTEPAARAVAQAMGDGTPWRGRADGPPGDDHSRRSEEWAVTPVRAPGGEVCNHVVVRRDVTQELELERNLARAQQLEAVGTLASGIAHDFNNLLSGIIGHAEITLDDVPPDGAGADNLRRIVLAGERGKELVHQLLAFSRHSEGELAPVSLIASVEEAVGLLRAALPKEVELRVHLDAAQDTVLGDPTQLLQALMNLCTNAAHALGEGGGVVELGLEPALVDENLASRNPDLNPGEYLRLTISDTGHGIPPEVLQHIYQPFFTTKPVGEGTGLGLSATHGIVRAHGGAISVFSTPGEGTTFHLFFPRCQGTAGEEHAEPQVGGERVLFVDDEEDVVELARQILDTAGYRVTATSDSTEALALLQAHPERFDVLVSDHAMPKLTGLELAEAARDLRPGLPVVLCSGYAQTRTRERARELGVSRFLLKPITVGDLGRAIREALGTESN